MANKKGTYDVVDCFEGGRFVEARYKGMTKYFDPYSEVSGALPLRYSSRAQWPLKNYRLYGTASGSGVATENLFNAEIEQGSVSQSGNFSDATNRVRTRVTNLEPGQTYTVTSSLYVRAAYEFINGFESTNKVGILVNNASGVKSPTFTMTTGNCVAIGFMDSSGTDITPSDISEVMLVLGSTAPSTYIPYGYKIPLTNNSTDYTLYIGSSKLGEDDFVDYASQKVYRLKEVHKDTVTIDGVVWDILGYDHDEVYKADGVTRAQHTVTIQAHDCIGQLQFDAPEAWYYAENGLAAGTYYFTIDPTYDASYNTYKDTGYQFTLANAVPAKGVLTMSWAINTQASGMKISSYATSTDTTAIETVNIEEGTNGTNLGELTSAGDPTNNLNSIARARYGSNNWKQSAMRQYLNSDKAAGNFWTPQTKFDRPPSWNASSNGFLRGVDPDFVSVLGNVQKVTAKNTVTDGGGTETTSEKVFLLSMTEAYCGGSEGTAYSFFKNYSDLSAAGGGADTNRIKYYNNAAKSWWLRSPYPSYANHTRRIYASGALNDYYSSSSGGVAPACCIILDDINTNPYLQSLFLKPVDPPVPLPEITAYNGENTLSSTETVGDVTVKGRIGPVV